MALPLTVDSLQSALNAIKTLRTSVGQVFETFGNGLRSDHGGEGKENKFYKELQELLNNVNTKLRDVETCVGNLNSPQNPFNLGNTSFLSQEYSPELQDLYTKLVNTYKWTDNVHKYCNFAHGILQKNSLKRSYITTHSQQKRRRLQTSYCSAPKHTVDSVLAHVDNILPDMNIEVSRPFASNVVLQVTLGKVLKAVVTFKGLLIEWVVIKGAVESQDLWTESNHKVFRKITDNAHAAMLHFNMPTMPEVTVRSFMTWLHSYNKVFSEPCKGCGLYLHNSMPPTWREFRTLDPYHEECKP